MKNKVIPAYISPTKGHHPREKVLHQVEAYTDVMATIQEEQVTLVVDFLKRCYADFTKNNWQKVLDFNGEYPEACEWEPKKRVRTKKVTA